MSDRVERMVEDMLDERFLEELSDAGFSYNFITGLYHEMGRPAPEEFQNRLRHAFESEAIRKVQELIEIDRKVLEARKDLRMGLFTDIAKGDVDGDFSGEE